MPTPIVAAEPFSPEKNQALADEFLREGCLLIRDVLTPGEGRACVACEPRVDSN